jgi:hypothetical protein
MTEAAKDLGRIAEARGVDAGQKGCIMKKTHNEPAEEPQKSNPPDQGFAGNSN